MKGNNTYELCKTIADKQADEQEKLEAARSLQKMGKDAKDAVPALIKIIEEEETELAAEAATALGFIGSDAQDSIPSLIKILQRPDKDKNIDGFAFTTDVLIKSNTMIALSEMGKIAVSALIPLLYNEDIHIRIALILARIGSAGHEATPYFLDLLVEENNKEKRFLWAITLAHIGIKNKIFPLSRYSKEDLAIEEEAVQILVTIGREDFPPAVDDLKNLGDYLCKLVGCLQATQ